MHVEIPKHTRQDGAHFKVRETKAGDVRLAHDGIDFIRRNGNGDSPLPDTASRAQGKRLEGGFVITSVFGGRIGKPALGVECVGGSKIVLATVCRPLMDTDRDLATSVRWSEVVNAEFNSRFQGHIFLRLPRLQGSLCEVVWLEQMDSIARTLAGLRPNKAVDLAC